MKKTHNNPAKNQNKQNSPVNPEKNIPVRPDENPDPTKPKPGGNEPEKNDPTRIEEPNKNDPNRLDDPPMAIPETHNINAIKH